MIFTILLLTILTATLTNLLLNTRDESSFQVAIDSMFSPYCQCAMNPRQIVFQALTNNSFDWLSYVDDNCICDLPDNFESKPPPEPDQLPGYLHALIDLRSREVYGVSYNLSYLEILLQTTTVKRNDIFSNSTSLLGIVALKLENTTTLATSKKREEVLGIRTDDQLPDLTERDRSSVVTWAIAYIVGGAVLNAVVRHTHSGVVRKVYKVYASLGYYVGYFISDVAFGIYQSFLGQPE